MWKGIPKIICDKINEGIERNLTSNKTFAYLSENDLAQYKRKSFRLFANNNN